MRLQHVNSLSNTYSPKQGLGLPVTLSMREGVAWTDRHSVDEQGCAFGGSLVTETERGSLSGGYDINPNVAVLLRKQADLSLSREVEGGQESGE